MKEVPFSVIQRFTTYWAFHDPESKVLAFDTAYKCGYKAAEEKYKKLLKEKEKKNDKV